MDHLDYNTKLVFRLTDLKKKIKATPNKFVVYKIYIFCNWPNWTGLNIHVEALLGQSNTPENTEF